MVDGSPQRKEGLMFAARLVALTVFVSALTAAPAGAITNGTLDPGHTYVGMLGRQGDDGLWQGQCSGFYGGNGTFVTAAHCLDWLESEGIAAEDLGVTFDTEVTWVVGSEDDYVEGAEWHSAVSYAIDGTMDYGAVRLAGVPAGLQPAEWPSLRQLDRMEARGGLRPRASFDQVGYGLIAGQARGWNTEYELSPGRMLATSRFKTLTDDWLRLNGNYHIKGNGGPCYGDSGGPTLIPGTDTVVAFSAGGQNFCWGYASNLRLDTQAARDFYDDFIDFE
jgi:hypothetical protein